MNKLTKLEIGLVSLLLVWFLFTATNVNPALGQIYAIFALSSIVYVLIDPKRDIALKKPNDSRLGALIVGAGAYVVLIIIGSYVIIPGVKSLLDLLVATTPVLSTNALINKIMFGIAIAATETLFFFVYGFDLVASLFNVKINKENLRSLKLWMIIIGISLAFMFFHLTSKGISVESIPILVLVFFMSVISLVLVTWFESGEQAVYFHCIANSLSVGLIPLFF